MDRNKAFDEWFEKQLMELSEDSRIEIFYPSALKSLLDTLPELLSNVVLGEEIESEGIISPSFKKGDIFLCLDDFYYEDQWASIEAFLDYREDGYGEGSRLTCFQRYREEMKPTLGFYKNLTLEFENGHIIDGGATLLMLNIDKKRDQSQFTLLSGNLGDQDEFDCEISYSKTYLRIGHVGLTPHFRVGNSLPKQAADTFAKSESSGKSTTGVMFL